MILTLTLNPSVDISYHLDKLNIDTVNRVSNVHKTAGGKGLNVTRVLSEISEEVLASGFLGGELGQYIERQLDDLDIEHDFYHIIGQTRNCIAVLHEGKQTEILEQGPEIEIEEAVQFSQHLKKLFQDTNVVVMSGSLPKGLNQNYYAEVIKIASKYQALTIIDSSGNSLKEVLNSPIKPTAIKPNLTELEELLGIQVSQDINQIKNVLNQPLFNGIEWIIVSLGGDGAVAKHKDKFYKVNIPKVDVVNPVGSGDSTVAGIASALAKQEPDDVLLKKANTLGILNAQEVQTGHINIKHYDDIYQKIEVLEV